MNHEVKVPLRAWKRNEFYQILSKIAILFSGIKGQAYEKAITNSLKLIGEFVKADRTYIYIYDFKKNTCSNVYEYCKEGISSVLDNLQDIPLAKIPTWVDAHQKNETVEVYDVNGLDNHTKEKVILVSHGIKSIMAIPFYINNELYGFIGLDSVVKKHKYSKIEEYILNDYAYLLADVLERQMLELDLDDERRRIKDILLATNIGLWEWDLQTEVLRVNDIWHELLGYKREELEPFTYHTWEYLMHPDDLLESKQVIQDLLDKKSQVYAMNSRMLHKDGSYRWIKSTGTVALWDNDKPLRISGTHVDITQIKNESQQLKIVTQAIEQSASSIVITDQDTVIQYVNPFFEKTTGYSSSEVIGKKTGLFKSGYHDKAFYKDLFDTVNAGEIWRGNFYNKRKKGMHYWESAVISGVFDSKGNITNYIAIKQDISDKVKENELLQQRRDDLENEVNIRLNEIEESQQSTIIALTKLTEQRDSYTGEHVERVQHLSKALASSLRDNIKFQHTIDTKFMKEIFYASALHDIGKIRVPDYILMKPGKLTDEEFETIKLHTKYGADILTDMIKYYPKSDLILMGRMIAKSHHEKYNGTGYPEGLSKEEIPLSARIMALVDVYDALRSERPYKKALSHEETVMIIKKDSGSHFDPDIVEAFLRIQDQFDAIYTSMSK